MSSDVHMCHMAWNSTCLAGASSLFSGSSGLGSLTSKTERRRSFSRASLVFIKVRAASYSRPYMYVILSPNHTVNALQCRMSRENKKKHTWHPPRPTEWTNWKPETHWPSHFSQSSSLPSLPQLSIKVLFQTEPSKLHFLAHTSVNKAERLCWSLMVNDG